jgi:hypothetical protein
MWDKRFLTNVKPWRLRPSKDIYLRDWVGSINDLLRVLSALGLSSAKKAFQSDWDLTKLDEIRARDEE